MTKFKKIILYISILTVSSILSINCVAMKNNDIKNSNTINNKEKQPQNPPNNNFTYNPFYGENFLNKKRNLKDEPNEKIENKNEEKSLDIKLKENLKEQSQIFSNSNFIYNPFYGEDFLNKKRNLKDENKDEQKNLDIKLEENLEEPNIKNQEEKNKENINTINNKIEEVSEEESFESSENHEDEESEEEFTNEALINDIRLKKENLKNILNDIKNDIEKRKNNLFILFNTYCTDYILKKMNKIKIRICQYILYYLIDIRMSKNKNWYSYFNKFLLKDFFKKYLKEEFSSGFYASLKPNFILPAFINAEGLNDELDKTKENAHNMLENFVEIFEDSKTEILQTCSNKKDIIDLEETEFLNITDKIFTLLKKYMIIKNDEYSEDNNHPKFNEDILKKIEELGEFKKDILKKIEELKKDETNLDKGIEEIHNYISKFLENNKGNIDKLKFHVSENDMNCLKLYNKNMVDIFEYSSELEDSFADLKNDFKDFTYKYFGNRFKDKDKKIFTETLESLTPKELHEVINNTYSHACVKQINQKLEDVDSTDLTYPIQITFEFKLDIPGDTGDNLITNFYDDIIKIIKTNIDKNAFTKDYIFSPHRIIENTDNKTSTLEFNLIYTNNNFSLLFFGDNIKDKVEWDFKEDVMDNCITNALKNKFPNHYANKLLYIYKKIIKDKNIDIKTLNVNQFLEEAKNFPMDEYLNKVIPKNINNIDSDEEKNFYTSLFNEIKRRYIIKNDDIINYFKNRFTYSFIGFQIDFMIETFAKNLKNRYSEFIKKILTKANINFNEECYKITDHDDEITNSLGRTPQEVNYSFNFSLLLKNSLFNSRDYIYKNLNDKKNKDLIIKKAIEDTIKELKEMPELEFQKKIKNHFEKNKDNIEKYTERKDLTNDFKNNLQDTLENFVNNAKKENFYINYLTHLSAMDSYKIYFYIKSFK